MLRLPLIFGNHMVLQREKPIAMWGMTEPWAEVAVRLWKEDHLLGEARGRAKADGSFSLTLTPQEAAWGLRMTVESGEECRFFEDILVGEVWIAGGQSNMQFWMEYDAEKEAVLPACENENIRFFATPEVPYEGAMQDYHYTDSGFWRHCNSENLPWFSAVGYYFAAQLEKSLGVPVGIVGCNWGGTRACCWMDEAYLKGTPGEIWLTEYEESLQGLNLEEYHHSYRSAPENVPSQLLPDPGAILLWPGLDDKEQEQFMAEDGTRPRPPYADFIGPDHPWRPCGLYRTMLKTIVPFTNRGVIWYQGESDSDHAEVYDTVLTRLIRNWRDLWGDELPFLMVQLAPFEKWLGADGGKFPLLFDCQQRVADSLPQVYLCGNGDGGMRWDIHPKHKRPAGERLALLARAHVYGQEVLCEAPRFREYRLQDGKAFLCFDHAEGLHIEGEEVHALMVNGLKANAWVEGDALVVPLPEGENWHLEYGCEIYYEINLYNQAHIPAFPFKVDMQG